MTLPDVCTLPKCYGWNRPQHGLCFQRVKGMQRNVGADQQPVALPDGREAPL